MVTVDASRRLSPRARIATKQRSSRSSLPDSQRRKVREIDQLIDNDIIESCHGSLVGDIIFDLTRITTIVVLRIITEISLRRSDEGKYIHKSASLLWGCASWDLFLLHVVLHVLFS